jgi:hypothetical protein
LPCVHYYQEYLYLSQFNNEKCLVNQHLQHGWWHSRGIGSRSALWAIRRAHTHYAHVFVGGAIPCLCTGLVTNLHG